MWQSLFELKIVIIKSFVLFLQNAILKASLAAVEEKKNADQKVLKLAEELKVCRLGSSFACY